jgi:hypothetical protein
LASAYQAKLKEIGEVVVVKVCRPGIGPLLSADLRALDWLLIFAETLTLIRPGLTTQSRRGLRMLFMGREIPWRAILESLQLMGWFQILVLCLTAQGLGARGCAGPKSRRGNDVRLKS